MQKNKATEQEVFMRKVNFLILMLFPSLAWSQPTYSTFQYNEKPIEKKQNELIDISNSNKKGLSIDGEGDLPGITSQDAINLGLAPQWVAVSDGVHSERMGYKRYQVYSASKKGTQIDNELKQFVLKQGVEASEDIENNSAIHLGLLRMHVTFQ